MESFREGTCPVHITSLLGVVAALAAATGSESRCLLQSLWLAGVDVHHAHLIHLETAMRLCPGTKRVSVGPASGSYCDSGRGSQCEYMSMGSTICKRILSMGKSKRSVCCSILKGRRKALIWLPCFLSTGLLVVRAAVSFRSGRSSLRSLRGVPLTYVAKGAVSMIAFFSPVVNTG